MVLEAGLQAGRSEAPGLGDGGQNGNAGSAAGAHRSGDIYV